MHLTNLIELSRFYADEIRLGKYPFVDFDPVDRWHQRLYRDQRMDVWLISWLPEQGTQLHDHGGSSGSFTVLSGVLTETTLRPGGQSGTATPQNRDHGDGASVGFGPRYVHDVRNLGAAPAVSVHVYSRPLTSMTYYDLEDGVLVPFAQVPTDDPEPAFSLRVA
ncbi:MAG: cysteine dioxygenase family protein [Actinomycetota bacterium]|nr:cysteine dioxygenase family protein [Actinomycetota bacterium]